MAPICPRLKEHELEGEEDWCHTWMLNYFFGVMLTNKQDGKWCEWVVFEGEWSELGKRGL